MSQRRSFNAEPISEPAFATKNAEAIVKIMPAGGQAAVRATNDGPAKAINPSSRRTEQLVDRAQLVITFVAAPTSPVS